jgi:acyl-CoA thioester hydrolase
MQVVYNGKYLEFFEVGRTELLRNLGLPYVEIEKLGYHLPVLESHLKFKNSAYYDDMLEIEAKMTELPKPKIHIEYIIRRKDTGDILVEGFTDHVFIREDTKRAVRPPQFFIDVLSPYLIEENVK